jgi:large subunit ribosomal protein L7/L12
VLHNRITNNQFKKNKMNIEQMLRDAIERKTAKILKEEYGIELSKELTDKLPEDGSDCEDYQIRLTNVGDHKIRVVKAVFNSMDVDLKTAKTLVDQAPSVISPCLTFERATEIVKLLNDAGATAHVEKIGCDDDPLDWTVIPPDEQNDQDKQDESVIPTSTTSKHVYQLVLTNPSGGVHREDIADIVERTEGSKPYANFVRTSNAPLVIARGLNYFVASELKKLIVGKGGDAVIEETIKVD